ncbi:hypothetical protein H8E88_02630, partial [candidate division KSB1 bacterium]|nr:hypothetical protein [candidate division KSB1 bacterium]
MNKANDLKKNNGSLVPKGLLVAVGGNEDKEHDLLVLRKILSLIKAQTLNIEIITTASEIPEELGEMYRKSFDRIGNTSVRFMHIRTREQAEEKQYIER